MAASPPTFLPKRAKVELSHAISLQCHKKCSVCLLTKMSNAFLKLGHFPIHFRGLTAFCLRNEELFVWFVFLSFC